VRTQHDEFIGNLPDDISKRLSYFIKNDSDYSTHIKEISLTDVVIFIREIVKGKKVNQYPSFPSNPHVMLSDIQHIDADTADGSDDDEDVDENEIDLTDETWEKYEQEKDLSSIVQLEDEEEEE